MTVLPLRTLCETRFMESSTAMIALNAPTPPSFAGIQETLAKQTPTLPAPEGVEEKDKTFTFHLGTAKVCIDFLPSAIDWAGLKGRLETSIQWKETADECLPHSAHVVVTVTGKEPVLASETLPAREEQMRLLTQVTSAVVIATDATGVFWTPSLMVFRAGRFLQLATDEPLSIWVAVSVGKHVKTGKVAGCTTGLESLGHMELECKNAGEPPEELLGRLYGMAKYVMANGAVIHDGDTFGEDANERIKIDYKESAFGRPGKVMRLTYSDAPTKSLLARMTLYGYASLILAIGVTIGLGMVVHSALSGWMGPILRHILLDLPLLIAGLIFLVVTDNIQRSIFGLEAIEDE
jgi:hypothetical protein